MNAMRQNGPTRRAVVAGARAHRRWQVIGVAGLVLIASACDRSSDSTSTMPQGTSTTPNASVGENDGESEAAGTSDGERYRTDGLTFVYPTEVYSSAAEQPPSGAPDAVVVDLATPSSGRDGQVVVAMVRSPEGLESDELSDDDRDLVARLGKLQADDSTQSRGELEGEVVRFVNGVGVNSVNEDMYRYEGLTSDGRFLVRVTGHGEDLAALDRIVSSVFVDGAAARFAGEACEEAVELLDENGLPEGETVEPGEEVTATWEVRNAGTCTWGSAHSWAFTGGEPVAIVEATISPAEVAPDESALMSVTFLAPETPGRYAAQWQLQPPRQRAAVAPAAFVLFDVVD